MSAPRLVAPPGLFSTMTGCPSALDAPSAATRAIRSLAPPAEKGTISRIGLTGQAGGVCASAPWLVAAMASPHQKPMRNMVVIDRGLRQICCSGKSQYREEHLSSEPPNLFSFDKPCL